MEPNSANGKLVSGVASSTSSRLTIALGTPLPKYRISPRAVTLFLSNALIFSIHSSDFGKEQRTGALLTLSHIVNLAVP